MNILLVIRGGYSLNDDDNVFLSDGTKTIYKDLLVLELGKNLKHKHKIEISTLNRISEKKDPIIPHTPVTNTLINNPPYHKFSKVHLICHDYKNHISKFLYNFPLSIQNLLLWFHNPNPIFF